MPATGFGTNMGGMKRIVIAMDGSASAAEAVRVGVDLAVEQGAAVTFVHVTSPAFATPAGRLAAATLLELIPVQEVDTALNAAAALARAAGVDADIEIVFGDAADEIVAYADTIDADMIVVGSRGLGTVMGLLLGSVSSAILQEARRPVLVARSAATLKEAVAHLPG
jgi:nucleotide-binding universal stress UspA family protein